jgi:hypothetical protein
MLLAQLISQAHMHAIFRLVSQDPRDRTYSQWLDVVVLKNGSRAWKGEICP